MNYAQHPPRTDVQDADQLVGYRTAAANGEGRWTFATLKTWVLSWLPAAEVNRWSHPDFSKSDTTLADVPELSIPVAALKYYRFRAVLHVNAQALNGWKVAVSAPADTSMFYHVTAINRDAAALLHSSRHAAAAEGDGSPAGASGAAGYLITIDGVMVSTNAGALKVQFAQYNNNDVFFGDPNSTVLSYSTFTAVEIPA